MSANKLPILPDAAEEGLAADAVAFCAKREEGRSGQVNRQAAGNDSI